MKRLFSLVYLHLLLTAYSLLLVPAKKAWMENIIGLARIEMRLFRPSMVIQVLLIQKEAAVSSLTLTIRHSKLKDSLNLLFLMNTKMECSQQP